MHQGNPSQFTSRLPPRPVTLLSPTRETSRLSGWYPWGCQPAQGSIWFHLGALLRSNREPGVWVQGTGA